MANTIWNVADKSSNVTLSGSNLIATAGSAAQGGVRAVDRQVTGKVYWECTLNTITGAGTGVGVSLAGFTITQNPSTTGVVGSCALVRSGLVHMGSGDVAGVAFGVIPNGTVVCIAYDIGVGTIWFRLGAAGLWNTNAAANPATGVGGILTSGLGSIWPIFPTTWFAGTSDQTTANFGDTAFVGAVPSGFTSGFVAGATVPTSLGAWGMVRETVITSNGVLNVQGLAREVVVASGVGPHNLIMQGLVREVVARPGAVGGPKQYAITVVT